MSFKDWWRKQEPHWWLLLLGVAAFSAWGCYMLLPQHPVLALFFGAMVVFIVVGLYLSW